MQLPNFILPAADYNNKLPVHDGAIGHSKDAAESLYLLVKNANKKTLGL
ncbi:hypothetical protein [Bacillus sp. UMB0893]|nr:hypothetical protein [Bacillus sp. UMB0893]